MAWLVFAAGFAAVFWLQQRGDSASALRLATLGSLRVVLPAAVLGVVVVRFCDRVPLRWPVGARDLAVQAGAAFAFVTLWIAAVNITSNILSGAAFGPQSWRFPPDHIVHWHFFTGTLIYASLASLAYGRAHVREAERRQLHAETRVLRGQLNPHFLFNTMHNVFALAQMDPDAGEDAMTRFSRLMRYTLLVHREDHESVSLADEWAFTEDYLHLEALRLESRLRWSADLDESVLDCAIPPLLLQPLIENAVKHGLRSHEGVRALRVTAERDGADLVVRVADDGPGTLVELALGSPGVGLQSVRRRVAMLTARADAVTIETAPGRGFRVSLRLPATHAARSYPPSSMRFAEAGVT